MMERFKSLTLGVRRALIAGTIPGAIIAGAIASSLSQEGLDGGDFFLYCLLWGIPIYWAIVFIGLWIHEGFKAS